MNSRIYVLVLVRMVGTFFKNCKCRTIYLEWVNNTVHTTYTYILTILQ